MSAITNKNLILRNPVVGASETDFVIGEFDSDTFSSLNFRLDMVCSSVTVAVGITAKLQHAAVGGSFEDLTSTNADVSVSGNGTFSIVMNVQNSTDYVDMPLRKQCRLVVTTGAGDAVTFDNVTVQLG